MVIWPRRIFPFAILTSNTAARVACQSFGPRLGRGRLLGVGVAFPCESLTRASKRVLPSVAPPGEPALQGPKRRHSMQQSIDRHVRLDAAIGARGNRAPWRSELPVVCSSCEALHTRAMQQTRKDQLTWPVVVVLCLVFRGWGERQPVGPELLGRLSRLEAIIHERPSTVEQAFPCRTEAPSPSVGREP